MWVIRNVLICDNCDREAEISYLLYLCTIRCPPQEFLFGSETQDYFNIAFSFWYVSNHVGHPWKGTWCKNDWSNALISFCGLCTCSLKPQPPFLPHRMHPTHNFCFPVDRYLWFWGKSILLVRFIDPAAWVDLSGEREPKLGVGVKGDFTELYKICE